LAWEGDGVGKMVEDNQAHDSLGDCANVSTRDTIPSAILEKRCSITRQKSQKKSVKAGACRDILRKAEGVKLFSVTL
jgi:hypothetical protein